MACALPGRLKCGGRICVEVSGGVFPSLGRLHGFQSAGYDPGISCLEGCGDVAPLQCRVDRSHIPRLDLFHPCSCPLRQRHFRFGVAQLVPVATTGEEVARPVFARSDQISPQGTVLWMGPFSWGLIDLSKIRGPVVVPPLTPPMHLRSCSYEATQVF